MMIQVSSDDLNVNTSNINYLYLKSALDVMKQALITTNLKGDVLYMNRIAEIYTGRSLNKVKNKNISHLINLNYRTLDANRIIKEVNKSGTVYYQNGITGKNKVRIQVDLSATLIKKNERSFINILFKEPDSPSRINQKRNKHRQISKCSKNINIAIDSNNPLITEGILRLLRLCDIDCIKSGSFTKFEYLEYIYSGNVDIILISDIDLGKGELLIKIRFIQNTDPQIKILVVSNNVNKKKELELIKSGVKGLFDCKYNFTHLPKAIYAVYLGDLWFRREILQEYIVETLSNKIKSVYYKPNIFHKLSRREKQIVTFVARDYKNSEIAKTLYLSEKTIKSYLTNLYKKFDLRNRKQLRDFALRIF